MSSAQRHPHAPDTGADRTGCPRSLLTGADALAHRSPKSAGAIAQVRASRSVSDGQS
jgi:hypothetical protein